MIKIGLSFKKLIAITICLIGSATLYAQDTIIKRTIKDNVVIEEITIITRETTSSSQNDEELNEDDPEQGELYKKMIELKKQYPEGMSWTNENFYQWKGGVYTIGYGCTGFTFILSDAAFGDLPARKHYDFNNLRIGDILRMNNDTHSVIIMKMTDTTITLAEGNYNSSIHWGRKLLIEDAKSQLDYIITRYPE